MYHLEYRFFGECIEYTFTDVKEAASFYNLTDKEIPNVVEIICIGIVPRKYLFNPYTTDKKVFTISNKYLIYHGNDLFCCKSLFEKHLRKVGIYL